VDVSADGFSGRWNWEARFPRQAVQQSYVCSQHVRHPGPPPVEATSAGACRGRERWTLLIVLALASGSARMSCLNDRLPDISAGVLDEHVRSMAAAGLLSRARFRERPPRVEIRLTDSGRELLPIASALARWGMTHRWSAPTEHQRVDAGALVRQMPALLNDIRLPGATVEVVVVRDADQLRYWFKIEEEGLVAAGAATGEPTLLLEGGEAAWIAALGPERYCASLSCRGEQRLASDLFKALSVHA
jgi:DNA-binding HxlR family transcriptional regulator